MTCFKIEPRLAFRVNSAAGERKDPNDNNRGVPVRGDHEMRETIEIIGPLKAYPRTQSSGGC